MFIFTTLQMLLLRWKFSKVKNVVVYVNIDYYPKFFKGVVKTNWPIVGKIVMVTTIVYLSQ